MTSAPAGPYPLKHWFDLVIQPGRTFRIGPDGPGGLLGGRPAAFLSTRSFLYGPGTPGEPANHLEPRVRTAFGFVGITDLVTVVADGVDVPGGEERLAAAVDAARTAAARF